MVLGIEITGFILVVCTIIIFIFREKIFSFKSIDDNSDFNNFLTDVNAYMLKHHPKIKIDYGIVEKIKNEKNEKLKKSIIIENVVEQFFNFHYEKRTQKHISMNKLWPGYSEKCASNPRFPNDWQQRKDLSYRNGNRCCNRCGETIISLNEAHTTFVKNIEDGGGYNFENIIILCADCNKIINSTNQRSTMHDLILNDKLISFIE